jgi:TatD DNase family protein
MLIDSHCHIDMLDLTDSEHGVQSLIADGKKLGVGHFLCVSVRLDEFQKMYELIEPYPEISASVGLHPNEIVSSEPSVETLVALANHDKIVAIGETGLDYYRTEADSKWQRDRFVTHIETARQTKLPLIIHTRQARKDTIDVIHQENARDIGGVMHCFTEDWEMAKKALDHNFYISFSGIVTFKNATELQDVAKKVPLDRMLVETDAPFLAPVPFRGKPNRPEYVKYVAEFVANLRGISVAEIEENTTRNFVSLFKKAVV